MFGFFKRKVVENDTAVVIRIHPAHMLETKSRSKSEKVWKKEIGILSKKIAKGLKLPSSEKKRLEQSLSFFINTDDRSRLAIVLPSNMAEDLRFLSNEVWKIGRTGTLSNMSCCNGGCDNGFHLNCCRGVFLDMNVVMKHNQGRNLIIPPSMKTGLWCADGPDEPIRFYSSRWSKKDHIYLDPFVHHHLDEDDSDDEDEDEDERW